MKKRKTPFEILKKELPLPKEITIDDADGTRLGTNGVYISDIIEIMEQYAQQEVNFISVNPPVSGQFYCWSEECDTGRCENICDACKKYKGNKQ